MKLLWLLALAVLACRVIAGRWPWQLLSVSATSREHKQACTLLGVSRDANRVEIIEAHRRLVAMVHPDRGGTSDQVIEANAARDLLLRSLTAGEPEQK